MYRNTRLAALAAIPLTALSLGAVAQPANPAAAPGTRPDFFAHMLEQMDTNGDGRISLDEYVAAAGARFKSIDTQNKGSIDAADIASSPAAVARIDHRVESIVKRLDTAGDGYVTKDEYLAAAQKRFARLDSNGDGKLTPDELASAREDHGGKPGKTGQGSSGGRAAFAQKRFDKLDTNHDGVISKDEFLAEAAAKFAQLDTAGNGKVTAAEIEAAPKTQERAVRMADRFIKRMDTNGDGVVTQDEFVAAAKARFAKLDKNGDGYLDADELRNAQRWAGMNHGPRQG
jgi:Ca2+-binding EF-hand superfamily protein